MKKPAAIQFPAIDLQNGMLQAPALSGAEEWLDPFWEGDFFPPGLPISESLAVCILALRQMPYDEYLRTYHWRAVRWRAIERAPLKQCQTGCGKDATDAHHVTYERRGFERPEDVMALCRACHETWHRTFKLRTLEEIRNLRQ